MRRPARRFGILVLALALVPGQFSSADAGVIPWLYDAVFGPVGHYGYGGYGYGGYAYRYPYAAPQVSYARPVAPASQMSSSCGPTGCGPAGCAVSSYVVPSYSVGYRPLFAAPTYCSTGSCSTVWGGYRCSTSGCGTCSVASSNTACAAKTVWKSEKSEPKEAKTEWETEVIRSEAAVPTPAAQDEAPKPKTFADEPADPSKEQPVAVEKVVAGGGTETGKGETAGADPDWTETGKPAAEVAAEGAAGDAATAASSGVSEEAAAAAVEGAVTEEAVAGDVDPGFGEALRGAEEDVNQIFTEPVKGVEAAIEGEGAPAITTPALPGGLEALPDPGPTLDVDKALPLELEEKSSWKFEVPVERIAFRAGFRRATIARTSVNVDADYVLPASVTLRLVSR